MNVRLAPTVWQDRRTAELMRHSDAIDEKRWKVLVAKNERRRLLQRQAGLQPVHVWGLGEAGGDRSGRRRPVGTADPSAWKLLFVRNVQRGWTSLRRLFEGEEAAK